MKKLLSVLLVLAMLCVSAAAMAETYTAEGQGNNGTVKVEVDVADGKIAAVRVVEHKETAGICDAAIERIPAAIVEKQSLAVDTVSGATNTSKAILAAVEAAVTEAGLDAEAMKTASAEAVELQQLADDHCQTVVVGAGGAGITTAVELKRGGNDVVLLEKMAITGGSTTLAATYFVVTNTESQIAGGMETSVEDYVAHELAIDPALDAERLTTLMNKSQETLNWMNELGADLTRPLSYYQVGTTDGSSIGPALMRAFNNAIETYGIDLRLENEATEIIVEDGAVKGVKVVTPEGWYNLYADNVVLATGGYASSDEVVNKYAPQWASLPYITAAGCTGDAIVMAEQIGAKMERLDAVKLNPSVHCENGKNVSVSAARAVGGIMVNMNGERFCNDYEPDYTTLSLWMMEQEGDYVYTVADQKAVAANKRIQQFVEMGYFLVADTVEELAQKMGVPEENLVKTIETYSKSVQNGVDEQFGRASNMGTDFTTAPYYASVTQPGRLATIGGIVVNDNVQVVKEDGSVFENLYAVGEVSYTATHNTGQAHNVYFGRLAAAHILSK